jgi:hypothetical protein
MPELWTVWPASFPFMLIIKYVENIDWEYFIYYNIFIVSVILLVYGIEYIIKGSKKYG